MLQGKVGAALRWMSDNGTGPMDVTGDVLSKLKDKHPSPNEIEKECLLYGPVYKVEKVLYDNIDADSIETAARFTKGGAGPSNVDTDMWRTLLCAKSGGKAKQDLCHAIAVFSRRLASELIDPHNIDSLVNSKLIPLDKNPGTRPIGIGEVLRRIIGKAVTFLTKTDVIKSVGPLQLTKLRLFSETIEKMANR